MKKKFLIIIFGIIFILIQGSVSIGKFNEISINEKHNIFNTINWKTIYLNNFNSGFDDWDTGSINGPDLWHITTFDFLSGDHSFACFDKDFKRYVNDMYFNWAIANITINVENEYEMVMDFYCKYITENINDNWGICLYDPVADEFIPFTYSYLPYETYGFHPEWLGLMQPMGVYQSFDILEAYDYGYSLGYFRNPDGSQAYDLKIGFMFFESDGVGTTNAEAESQDIYWSGLIIDDVLIRHIVFNQEPLTPDKPSGETSLKLGISYEFTTFSTDPDEDNIRYGWDWDEDGIVDYLTNYVSSGEYVTASHMWVTEDVFNIRVRAEDEHGAFSDFSEPLVVTITENLPPNKPTIIGETNGKIGEEYDYTISSIDPDGDDVYFEIEWFDGCPGIFWEGPYKSGEQVIKSNIWNERGEHTITVWVKDSYDLEGESATLSITMPRIKMNSNYNILWEIFKEFFLINNLLF